MGSSSGLYDSALLASGILNVENYLYVAQMSSQPIFSAIQEDMAQLNDFCLLCVEETSNHLTELRRAVKRYRSGEERIEDPDIGDVSHEVVLGLEEIEIPSWQDSERFLVRAMCLILLFAFAEKGLKDVAVYLAPPEAPTYKNRGGGGEIEALLKYLQQTCFLGFHEPETSRIERLKCRRIRNDLAHGQWDNIKALVADQSLPAAFSSVAKLFYVIDRASAINLIC